MFHRRTPIAAALVFAALTLIATHAGDPPVASPTAGSPSDATVNDARIYDLLAKPVPQLDMAEVSLENVFLFVSELTHAPIRVDWPGLETVGVSRDKPISIRTSGVSTERLLRMILEAASNDPPLGYEVREGVLFIASREVLEKEQIVRIYPVRDLLIALAITQSRIAGTPLVVRTPDSANDLVRAADPDYREALAQAAANAQPAGALNAHLLQIAEVVLKNNIEMVIDPDAWRETGGSCTIQFLNGMMTVRAPRTIHRALQFFLTSLRAADAASLNWTAPVPPRLPPTTQAAAGPIVATPGVDWTAEQQVLDRLAASASFAFQEAPLEQVVDEISRLTKIQIVVDWLDLANNGVGEDKPIRFRAQDVSAARALSIILQQAGGDVRLQFEPRDNTLFITTADKLSKSCMIRIYTVRDLLDQFVATHPRRADEPLTSTERVTADDPYTVAAKELSQTMFQTISPDCWRESGGGEASIRYFSQTLIVYAPRAEQRAVEQFLVTLRAVGNSPAPTPKPRP